LKVIFQDEASVLVVYGECVQQVLPQSNEVHRIDEEEVN